MKTRFKSLIALVAVCFFLLFLFFETTNPLHNSKPAGGSTLTGEPGVQKAKPSRSSMPHGIPPESSLPNEISILNEHEYSWGYGDDAESEDHLITTMNAIGCLKQLRGNELHAGIASVVEDMSRLAVAICSNHDQFRPISLDDTKKAFQNSDPQIPFYCIFMRPSADTDPKVRKAYDSFLDRKAETSRRRAWVGVAAGNHRVLLGRLQSALDDMVLAGSVTKNGTETIIRQVKLPQGKWHEIMGPGGNDALLD